jgi:hypothetical protein
VPCLSIATASSIRSRFLRFGSIHVPVKPDQHLHHHPLISPNHTIATTSLPAQTLGQLLGIALQSPRRDPRSAICSPIDIALSRPHPPPPPLPQWATRMAKRPNQPRGDTLAGRVLTSPPRPRHLDPAHTKARGPPMAPTAAVRGPGGEAGLICPF